jgi:hypothetical protein
MAENPLKAAEDLLLGKEELKPLSGPEYLVANVGFDAELREIGKELGEDVEPLPENLTDEQLLTMEYALIDTIDSWGFRQLFRYRELQTERRRRQLKFDEKQTGELRTEEYVATSQALTYHQYMPAAAGQVVDFMGVYNEQVDPFVMSLPEPQRTEILREKLEATRYIMALRNSMKERVFIAQLMMVEFQISESHTTLQKPAEDAPKLLKLDYAEGKKRQEQYKANRLALMLRRQELIKELIVLEERRVVTLPKHEKDDPAATMKYADMLRDGPVDKPLPEEDLHNRKVRARQLDELTLQIMAGQTKIPDVTAGFIPQNLYGDAMPHYYTQILDGAVAIAMKHKGENPLAHAKAMEQLSEIRRELMEQMIVETNARAQYQLAASEMLATQNLLGEFLVTEGSASASPIETDEELRKKIAESIEQRKHGHLGRMRGMVRSVETGFFDVPVDTKVREWIFGKFFKDLTVHKVADRLADFFSAPALIPGLQKGLKDKLTAPLEKAMFYDKDLKRMLDPEDPDDLKRIEKRLELVTNVIAKFQETNTAQDLGETIDVIGIMPPMSKFVGGTVKPGLLPGGRITLAYAKGRIMDKQKPMTADEGKTLYDALEKQKDADFKAFMTAYEAFLSEIENIIDVRIDLKASLKQLQAEWEDLSRWYLMAGGAALVTPLVAYRVYKLARIAVQQGWKGASAMLRNSVRSAPVTAAFVMHGFRTYEHLGEWGQHELQLEKDKGSVVTELVASGFVQKEADSDIYIYKDGDMEVEVSVSDVTESLDTRKWEDWTRIGGDVAQGGILAWSMKVGRLRSAALPYVLVEAGIKFANEKTKRTAQKNAITKFPPWLVSLLQLRGNLETAMGNSTFEVADKQPQNVREKMVWAMFSQEVAAIDDWNAQIFPGGHNVHDLKEYFDVSESGNHEGIFFDDFLPSFYALLHSEYGTRRASMSRIETADVTSNFTYVEVRSVMRKAIILYIENLKERRLVDATIALRKERLKDKPDTSIISVLEGVIESLEGVEVFGKELSMLELEDKTLKELMEYETRGHRIGALLHKGAQSGDVRGVAADIEEILEGTGFTFSTEGLIKLVDDEVTRFNIGNVMPLTATEGEPLVKPSWYHQLVPGQRNDRVENFGGHKMEKVHQQYYLDALMVLHEAANKAAPNAKNSIAVSQQQITLEAARLISTSRDVTPEITRSKTTGLLTLTRAGDKPPLEFTRFAHWKPRLDKLPPEFRDLPVQAHFQEALPIGKRHYSGTEKNMGESVVLSTVILGDPLDPKNMVVVQWAMVDWYFIQKKVEMEDFVGLRYLPIFLSEKDLYMTYTNNGEHQHRSRHFMVGQPVISSATAFASKERGGKSMIEHVVAAGKREASLKVRNARRDVEVAAEIPGYRALQKRYEDMSAAEFDREVNQGNLMASRSTDAYVATPIVSISPKGKEERDFVLMMSYHPDRRSLTDHQRDSIVLRTDMPRVPIIRKPSDGHSMSAPQWPRTTERIGSRTFSLTGKRLTYRYGSEEEFNAGKAKPMRVPALFPWKYTEEDYRTVRTVLSTPFSHESPRWFHEHTVETLLNQCVVEQNKEGMGYFILFQLDIIDLYQASYDKKLFLGKLFDSIMEGENGGLLTPARTEKILSIMKGAIVSGEFRDSVVDFSREVRSSISLPGGHKLSVVPCYETGVADGKKVTYIVYILRSLPPGSKLEVHMPKGAVGGRVIPNGKGGDSFAALFPGSMPPEGTTFTVTDKEGKVITRNHPLRVSTKESTVVIPKSGLKK